MEWISGLTFNLDRSEEGRPENSSLLPPGILERVLRAALFRMYAVMERGVPLPEQIEPAKPIERLESQFIGVPGIVLARRLAAVFSKILGPLKKSAGI